ncbi:MAG TPA: HAD family phosphatase [Gemmatimonadales bacterium]|nr:HAD family phosphatase [Gemmatimonadales bacterium]
MTPAVLFDFNGVLVDDEEHHCAALRIALEAEGIELSREVYYAEYLGFDDRRCVVEAFRRAGRTPTAEHLDRLIAAKARVYEELIARDLVLVPGAAEFVRGAAARFRLAVVSGALRREIDLVLERTGLRPYFEAIFAAEDVRRCKPHPEGYLAARATLDRAARLPHGHCVVIEDSLPGLEAARAADMPCVMLSTSHPAAALSAADLVWESFAGHDPAELLPLLDR